MKYSSIFPIIHAINFLIAKLSTSLYVRRRRNKRMSAIFFNASSQKDGKEDENAEEEK